jgi:hypothetical protein
MIEKGSNLEVTGSLCALAWRLGTVFYDESSIGVYKSPAGERVRKRSALEARRPTLRSRVIPYVAMKLGEWWW